MHKRLLNTICCPSCRSTLSCDIESISQEQIISEAILYCASCFTSVPVVKGFPLFGEVRPFFPSTSKQWLSEMNNHFVSEDQYEAFIQQKSLRGTIDSYAAFQPFNESSRTFYPLIELIKEKLQPGDLILDLWGRTGWSAELLAGLFPDQHIISIWEGDGNVLGYKGYEYWLGEGHRSSNIDVIFTHPNQPLPFRDSSFKFVLGLDTLHRYFQGTILSEVLRVSRQDALLLFPHIHMTNSHPEPFFERGCHQYHGAEWKEWLDLVLQDDLRKGWVFSEPEMFLRTPFTLQDASSTTDYNGVILIADSSSEERLFYTGRNLPVTLASRCIVNPLIETDLNSCSVHLSTKGLAGQSFQMLERHPCYLEVIKEKLETRISPDQALCLKYASEYKTVSQIAVITGKSHLDVIGLITDLAQREIVHVAPVSERTAQLQAFHSGSYTAKQNPKTFQDIWARVPELYSENSIIYSPGDELELGFEDVNYLVNGIRVALKSEGLEVGDRILIEGVAAPETILLAWASLLEGIVVVMIEPGMTASSINDISFRAEAKFFFFSESNVNLINRDLSFISFKIEELTAPECPDFESWLEPHLEGELVRCEVTPDSEALILFTSGSTGKPKGVVFSQSALCNSGYTMANHHEWDRERLLSMGSLSTMSGFRNPIISSLISSSMIVLCRQETSSNPLKAWKQAIDASVSILLAVPAWYQLLLQYGEGRIDRNSSLKNLFVTGAPLQSTLKESVEETIGVSLINYYGLTETGGICLSSYGTQQNCDGFLPVSNALMQLVDEEGVVVNNGSIGHLRVNSEQLMSGYLNDAQSTGLVLNKGWLHTGDLAKRLEDGRFMLVGRDDDQIQLRNGSRIYPVVIENSLSELDAIEDVCILQSDHDASLIAVIKSNEDEELIRELIYRKLDKDLCPRKLVLLREMPKVTNGKIDRAAIADLVREKGINGTV